MSKHRILPYLLYLLAVICFAGCDTSISDYTPGNRDEQEIISVLIRFQEAKNAHDIERLLPLLHGRGQFSHECGIMVSKDELAEKLPDFWSIMASEKLARVPMSHECLNGDYYPSGILKEPIIEITGSTARARVWFTRRFCSSLLLFFQLVREDGQWLIMQTEWGPS